MIIRFQALFQHNLDQDKMLTKDDWMYCMLLLKTINTTNITIGSNYFTKVSNYSH